MSDKYILPSHTVKGKLVGNRLKLSTAVGNPNPIKKVDKDWYIDKDGNMKQFNHSSESRADNIESMKNTMKNLTDLINNNFFGWYNELWLTLTYAENMTDIPTLRKDYKQFIRKIQTKYGPLEYIYAIEPQERGAWHIHALIKSRLDKPLYIPNSVIEKKWGKGFTKTKRLKNSDNVGAYLSAYLTNVDVTGTEQENDEDVYTPANTNKRIKKNARLYMYPPYTKFYIKSNGIVPPEEMTAKKYEVMKHFNAINSPFLPDNYFIFSVTDNNNVNHVFEKETYKIRKED